MKKYYYVVERELESDGAFDYATDSKGITVYNIEDNIPVPLILMNCEVELQTEDVIKNYLDKQGYVDYQLIKL